MTAFLKPLGGLTAISRFCRPARRTILAIGHPRCGSGSTAAFMRACGFDTGHEEMGQDGISSWMFAAHSVSVPYGGESPLSWSPLNTRFDVVIQHLRNPFDAIPSIIAENRTPPSYEFRRSHIRDAFEFDIAQFDSELDRAVASYLFWNKLIELRNPDFVFRIEDQGPELRAFLAARFPQRMAAGAEIPMPRENGFEAHFGMAERPEPSSESWRTLIAPLRNALEAFCATYGYQSRLHG